MIGDRSIEKLVVDDNAKISEELENLLEVDSLKEGLLKT